MDDKIVLGYLFLGAGILIFVLSLLAIILNLFKVGIKGYKVVTGKVIKSVNMDSKEYEESTRKKLKEEHPKYYSFMNNLAKTINDSGMVNDSHNKNYRGAAYLSVIEYLVSGKKYTIMSSLGRDRKEKKGTKYKIKYDPSNPKEAYIANNPAHKVLFIMAIAFFAIGYWLLYK